MAKAFESFQKSAELLNSFASMVIEKDKEDQ
jgi:hypothetical protein